MACGYNQWNKRLVIWHFYVDRAERRKGFGRQLMDCALSAGRQWGARTAWAETSNVNYPGVIAYQRLGFKLCGFDATLYQGTVNEASLGYFWPAISDPCSSMNRVQQQPGFPRRRENGNVQS